ncbi:MAG: fibronectin-binding domain-containing protein [Methanomicrobiales archaeon]|nr:fibronectin-binding domain-containing protein [Methanomicrobiales archaeon]
MATLEGMGGVDLLGMLSELEATLPLWIGKIYQYDAKTLGFRLNGENKERRFLCVEAGRRAHTVSVPPAAPENPSGYCMLLRKYLTGGKVLSIRQHGLERIFEIVVGKKETTFSLIVELFGEGNVILTDASHTIIKPLWHHRFRDREVVPGVEYVFTGTGRVSYTAEEFDGMLAASGRDLVRTLARDFMLGGTYAEEVCRRAGIDKTTPAREAPAGAVRAAYDECLRLAAATASPAITASGCWPFLFGDEPATARFDRFSAALEAFYPAPAVAEKEEKPRLSREERIRRQQEEAITRFEAEIRRLEEAVETIYANYPLVDDMIRTLSAASERRSWQEIEAILKASDNEAARAVVKVHPADAAVDLALDPAVTIHVHESVEANVGRYYDRIKKMKKKKAGAEAAMERPVAAEMPVRKKGPAGAKPRWYHRFRWSYTSDGVLLIGGRDADQNEELVKRYMEGGDLFLHADVHGASVVLVKGTTQHMDEAAQFAGSYSGAWRAGHASVDVYAALPAQVSKTPEAGEYVARGSFIVRGERTWYRDVELGVAIGVRYEPSCTVIGGPVAAVAARARVWVVLRPGTYEPNDTAKKVLRALKERIPPEDQKSMKNILSTEKVAAFVPPGGSDIEGLYESRV